MNVHTEDGPLFFLPRTADEEDNLTKVVTGVETRCGSG